MKKMKQIKMNTFIIYTFAFILISSIVFSVFYLRNYSLVAEYDGVGQHYPMLVKLREIIINRIKKPFSPINFWTWNLGIGSDVIHSMSYYGLGDIISYLIILFPTKNLEFGYGLLMILRIYLAGISLIFYLKKYNYSSVINISSAIFYAFCGTLLMFVHPFFANPLILLPLLLKAIDKVFENQSARMFIWIVAYTFINNFYFAYMLVIMAVFYTILQYLFVYKEKMSFWSIFLKLAINSLVGLMISCVLFVPSVLGMLNSTRSDTPFANGVKIYPLNYYLKLLKALIGPVEYLPYSTKLAFASIVVYAIAFIVFRRKQYKTLFVSIIIGFIVLLIPYGASIMNGFTSPANRWAFGLAFLFAISLAHFLANIKELSIKELKIYIMVFLVFIFFYWVQPGYNPYNLDMMMPLIFLTINLVLIVLSYVQKKERIFSINMLNLFLIVLCLNVATTGNYYFSNLGNDNSSRRREGNTINESIENQYNGLEKNINDFGFFRVSPMAQGSTYNLEQVNNSLFRNQPEVSSYLSIQNRYVGDFSRAIKNNQFTMTNPLKQLDDRTVLENYLGIKYLFVNDNEISRVPYMYKFTGEKSGAMSLYKSDLTLPIAFMNYHTISQNKYNKLSELEKEDFLIRGIVTENSKDSHEKASQITSYEKLDFKFTEEVTNTLEISQDKKEYVINLSAPFKNKNKELYLKISGLNYEPYNFSERWQDRKNNNWVHRRTTYDFFMNNIGAHYSDGYIINFNTETKSNSIRQYTKFDPSSYDPRKDFLVHLGYSDKERSKITIQTNDLGYFSFDNIEIIAKDFTEEYIDQTKKLQTQSLKDIQFSANKLKGRIQTEKEGYLVTSIPYSSGWKIYIDGKESKVERANIAFLSTYLNKGTHTIEFVYKTPGFKIGLILSILGVSIWLMLEILIFYKKDKS